MYLRSLLFALAASVSALPTFPNIEYLMAGYNLIFGNPNPISGAADPGFTAERIIDLTYQRNTTYDNQWLVPDGFNVLRADSCAYSCASATIWDGFGYQQQLNASVAFSASVGGFLAWLFKITPASFTASADFAKYFSLNGSSTTAFMGCISSCTAYRATTDSFGWSPAFSSSFKAGVAGLGSSVSFSDFVAAFGTNYAKSITMGGIGVYFSELQAAALQQLEAANVDVNAAAAVDFAVHIGGSASAFANYNDWLAYNLTSKVTLLSGIPQTPPACVDPACNDIGTWETRVQADPYPMSYTLGFLPDLLTEANFPGDPNISSKALGLAMYIGLEYCASIPDCGAPLPPTSNMTGLLAYFSSTACPPDWVQASQQVTGRVLVSTAYPTRAGRIVGLDAVPANTPPTHGHVFNGSAMYFNVEHVETCGDGNYTLPANGPQPFHGQLSAMTLGLPFVQLLACSYAGMAQLSYPSGAVIMMDPLGPAAASCPTSFVPYSPGEGFVLTPSSGGLTRSTLTPGISIPAPLGMHNHNVTAVWNAPTVGVGEACQDDCDANIAQGGYDFAYTDPNPVGGDDSTESVLPYASVMTCAAAAATSGTAALPSGMLLFVNNGACPSGWTAVGPSIDGRLPIAVNASANVLMPLDSNVAILPGQAAYAGAPHAHAGNAQVFTCRDPGVAGCEAYTACFWQGDNSCISWPAAPVDAKSVSSTSATVTVPYLLMTACVKQ